jgi:hypothetical protein
VKNKKRDEKCDTNLQDRGHGVSADMGIFVVIMLAVVLVFRTETARRAQAQNAPASQNDPHAFIDLNGNNAPKGDPNKPLGLPEDRDRLYIPEEDYIQSPLPPGDGKYAKIDGNIIKKTEAEIVAISEKSRIDGNQYWGRISGTPYDHMTSDYMEAQFKKLGLETRRWSNDLPPQWFPTSWGAELVVGGKAIPLKSAWPVGQSVGTTKGPVEAEPVWVGLGFAADFKGRDVKGKAVFVYSWPTDGGVFTSSQWTGAYERALASGAAMVYLVQGFPGDQQSMLFGNYGGRTEMTPLSAVPAMTISHDDGFAVREAIEKGGDVKLRMRLDVKIVSGLHTDTVLATLPGQSDETILVMAHHDAYFDGATDNASGMATSLELARYYAGIPREQRRRTMVFEDSPTHHSPGVVGSVWIRMNMQDWLANKVVLIANCEHTAETQIYYFGGGLLTANMASARRWSVEGSDALKKLVPATLREYGVAVHMVSSTAGGDMGQLHTTAPSFGVIDNILNHSTMDTVDWTPAYSMGMVARSYAKIFDQVNKMSKEEIRGPNFHPTFPPPR